MSLVVGVLIMVTGVTALLGLVCYLVDRSTARQEHKR